MLMIFMGSATCPHVSLSVVQISGTVVSYEIYEADCTAWAIVPCNRIAVCVLGVQ